MQIYFYTWIMLTLVGLFFIIKNHKELLLFKKKYFIFLLRSWKFGSFILASTILCYISTFGYDPTWDIPETIIMAVLTYWTAPYTVGTIYRFFNKFHQNYYELYVAIILLMFSSAWFYDAYAMFFLIGEYPPTAFANLGLSPLFYIFAGMMWSLDSWKDTGAIFVYTFPEWIGFRGDAGITRGILIYSIPFILFMSVIFGSFIYMNR